MFRTNRKSPYHTTVPSATKKIRTSLSQHPCPLHSAAMNPTAAEEAFQRVQQLADTFKANEKRYLSAEYQEAEARKDFIDKFFIALGWDVNHDIQTNP